MKYALFIFIFFSLVLNGQDTPPIHDVDYIPKNLSECIIQLDELVTDSSKIEIRKLSEQEFIHQAHFTWGRKIRNDWGLWRGSRLSYYFNELSVDHPEEMSTIILRSFYRHNIGKPLRFLEQLSINGNEDSLLTITPNYDPSNKIKHYVRLGIGGRNIDYNELNKILERNGYSVIKSPATICSIEYLGKYKKIQWTIGLCLNQGAFDIENMYDFSIDFLKLGGGVTLFKKRRLLATSSITFSISNFNFFLQAKDNEIINIDGLIQDDIHLYQKTYSINPTLDLYRISRSEDSFWGIRIGYNKDLGKNNFRKDFGSIQDAPVSVNGLEIQFSIITKPWN